MKQYAWHALVVERVVERLEVDPEQGLADAEVGARRDRDGENRLAEKPPPPDWLLFVQQFNSLLIWVLIGAAVLAGAIGDLKDAVVILAVVMFNAVLGFWQEHRAEATLAALKKMLSPKARVRRAGGVIEVPARELVPGDVVLLESGNRVPADGRLFETKGLELDESTLTGESEVVGKFPDVVEADVPLAERFNMAYMNTLVARGRGQMVVTATGMQTEMGRLSAMLEEAEPGPTPLQTQLDQLGRRLSMIAGVIIVFILALGLLRKAPLVELVLSSIALAVAAIPEGLPAVVTVTLALGMHRMAKQRAIVKKLGSVETLGCTTVICSDKTGTLTLNQMTARALYFEGRRFEVTGEGYASDGRIEDDSGTNFDLVLIPAALCNDSRVREGRVIGAPTEGALRTLANKGGISPEELARRYPRLAEIPFDAANKYKATFHLDGEVVRVFVVGAPEVLLDRSSNVHGREAPTALDQEGRESMLAENRHLADDAMRVLGVATRELPVGTFNPVGDLHGHLSDLTFLALVGLMDPPRPEVADAIDLCARAGIEVKMITGDHPHTASAIASRLGLVGDVVTGAEFDAWSDEEASERIDDVIVFARVAPEHKVRIVQRLKAKDHVVAMTGDGVNDAPALKTADIGVAMGKGGTEVTKEAATMVLTDDNFATIVNAVEEGRGIYDNILKFVRFQLSTNMGAIQAVLGASLLGWGTPFTAIQILWINIVMDGPPAMTLGLEPVRPGVMNEPPRRRDARILTARRFLLLMFHGFIMAVGTLAVYRLHLDQGGARATTIAFTTFVLFQIFNLFNARRERKSVFNREIFKNFRLWGAVVAVLVLQAVVVHFPPAQGILKTTDLTGNDWALAAGTAASVMIADELRKLLVNLFGPKHLPPPSSRRDAVR